MNWVSVQDRLPPNDIYVLVCLYDGRPKVEMNFIRIAARFNKEWVDDHNGEKIDPKFGSITHWMLLPDSPKKN